MKKSIIIVLSCFIGLLGFTGCEDDFLEADNKSAVTANEQFTTQEGFESLVNQAYFSLRKIYEAPDMFCSGTDLFVGIRDAGDSELHAYSLTSDHETVKSLYSGLYALVNSANAVLYYADLCEDFTEKELRKEEARFIRAYAYYLISQQFGRASIIENYINTAETSYPRSSLQATYDFVIGELEALSGSALLPAIDKTGRAHVQAVNALLAKVYLAAGWDLETSLSDAKNGTFSIDGTSYFTKAATKAAEVVYPISLTQTFDEKWSPFNEGNAEEIFAIQFDQASSLDQVMGGHSQQNNFGSYLGATTLGMKYVASSFNPTTKVYYLYEPNDTRYEATFMTTIYNYEDKWAEEGYWAYYNLSEAAQANLGIAFYFPAWYVTDAEIADYQTANAERFVQGDAKNRTQIIRTAEPVRWIEYNNDGTVKNDNNQSYTEALTKVGTIPPVKKFDFPTTDEGAENDGSYRDFVVLNVSDIYLVAAEANLMAGKNGEALTYLNNVRTRAGVATLNSFSEYQRYEPVLGAYEPVDQEIDVILDERARELLGEYYRWMDLRRTRQLVKYNIEWNVNFNYDNMVGADGNIKWLRPIPADEIGLNTGISSSDQNPGYTADTAEE